MTDIERAPNNQVLSILERIKNSREIERASLSRRAPVSFDIRDLGKKIEEVAHYNGKIEDSVRMELLGIKDGFLNRTRYAILRKIKGGTEPAEKIISEQIDRVGVVSSELKAYADHIDQRTVGLEERYNGILDDMLKKHDENNLIKREIERRKEIISYSGSTDELDLSERVALAKEQRSNRRDILTAMHKSKMNDRAVSLLVAEIPILDSLSAIAQTYSFTLREIHQESEMLGDHLRSVSSTYIDMMRSQRINLNLGAEVSKLFIYTSSMVKSLNGGAKLIIDRAKKGSLIEKNYSYIGREAGNILGDIENITFKEFSDLERRLNIE